MKKPSSPRGGRLPQPPEAILVEGEPRELSRPAEILGKAPPGPRRDYGFTLVELLVVVGIVAMISSLAITYSSASRNQIVLSREEASIGSLILKAKSLTITTKRQNLNVPCGYGLYIDYSQSKYFIFSYSLLSSGVTCSDVIKAGFNPNGSSNPFDNPPSPIGDNYLATLPPNVKFAAKAPKLYMVFFLAPNPDTFIATEDSSGNEGIFQDSATASVYLQTIDGGAQKEISVSAPTGDVNF